MPIAAYYICVEWMTKKRKGNEMSSLKQTTRDLITIYRMTGRQMTKAARKQNARALRRVRKNRSK